MDVAYEWIQTNIVSVINNAIIEYGGGNLFFTVLFVSCFTLLILNKDRIKRGHSLLAVYSAVLILLVLLNPIILTRFDLIKELFAALPAGVIIALVIASKTTDMSGKMKQNLIAFGLAVLIALVGLTIKEPFFSNPVNLYKVDDQGVYLARYILEDAGGEPVTVCYILRGGDHTGIDMSAYDVAEQYSGKIRAEAVIFSDAVETGGPDYLVINNEIIGADSIDKTGYELVYDTGYYSVFGVV